MDSQSFTNPTNNSNMNDDQLDNLSNLIINTSTGGGAESALIEQFEYDMDKALNENLITEKEQMNQRLFQSFQTSACTVAQMFKDKSDSGQSQLSSWQSFQNAAGAITVLYKDSLESCKAHYELGIAAGQQRKLKEILSWVKKKKRRTIRKDELLSFLLGRQLMGEEGNVLAGGSTGSGAMDAAMTGSATAAIMTASSSGMFPSKQPFLFRQQSIQQQNQAPNRSVATGAADTSSDLATFREALIMHNRSRDHPMPPPPPTYPTTHLHSTASHHHHHHHHHPTQPCDDLDCFFCEQIATHVDHKRSASQNSNLGNFDMESPTRKRGRFY